ncbi:hypothetical protein HY414_02445 [Candidatus Kaiserbacteria bacterium]|nr:hypothetical protein [Candidatus Kaiserbacteria bacterium]
MLALALTVSASADHEKIGRGLICDTESQVAQAIAPTRRELDALNGDCGFATVVYLRGATVATKMRGAREYKITRILILRYISPQKTLRKPVVRYTFFPVRGEWPI